MTTLNTQEKRDFYLHAFTERHACKEFDDTKKISEADFNFILETARLSPSSLGLEPWRFLVIQNKALREKIREYTWGGLKQIPTASHVIVTLARKAKDMTYPSEYIEEKLFKRRNLPSDIEAQYRERLGKFQKEDFELLNDPRNVEDWAGKQCYIVLGNMMNAAALIGIDSCAIEGFSKQKLSEILAKECGVDLATFTPSYVVAFGYRKNEPRPKLRSEMSELVEWFE